MIEFPDILDDKKMLKKTWKKIAKHSKGSFKLGRWGTVKGYIISPKDDLLGNRFLVEEAIRGGKTSLGVVLQPHPSSSSHPLLEHETNPIAVLLLRGNAGLAWLRGGISLEKTARNLFLQSHSPAAVLVMIVGKNYEGQVGYYKYHLAEGPLGWEVNLNARKTFRGGWKTSLSFTNVKEPSERPTKLKGVQVNRGAQRILNAYIVREFGPTLVKEFNLRVYPASENIAKIGLSVRIAGIPNPSIFEKVNELMNHAINLARGPKNFGLVALKMTNYEPEKWLEGKKK